MTVYSKANLMVSKVASKEAFDRGLHGVRLEPDGSTVGGSKRGLMVVSPVDVRKAVVPPKVGEPAGVGDQGIIVSLPHVADVIKNMPKATGRAELQYVVLTKGSDLGKVEFTTYDHTSMHKISQSAKTDRSYGDWKASVRRIVPDPTVSGSRVVVSRKELIRMLQALDSACPEKGGYDPVWIQFGEGGLVMRCHNWMTGQVALAIAMPFERPVAWLDWSAWEQKIWAGVKKIKKIVRRLRRN